jgi:type II secretory pathway predicted ATPase ExeA
VALYVPSQCSTYLGAPHSFDLVDKFEEYLDKQSDGQQLKVLLLMGDSGSGKTSFSERFVIKRNSIPKKQELAVYISLPTIRDTTFILEEFLEGYAFSEDEIQQLQQTQSFLFVLDGYDELARCFNIYDSNGF